MASTPDTSSFESRWIGHVIDDRYKIVEVLGKGGMGAVFVAEQLRLQKLVALKTIKPEYAGHSQAKARFEREALATGHLDHPHVASAIDFGTLPDGGSYLVTQLVRGESLSKRLEAGPLPLPQVCLLGMQIADALAAAHAIGIIHRDLKPDNILLEQRRDGALHVRVVDFGIAHVSGDNPGTMADLSQPMTRAGSIIGTPGYMPPEQGTGQAIDLRVDLYALGVIMWEAFAGQRLWQGDTLTELLARQLGRPAPSLRGDVPEPMADIIERLLARNPAERPASALEVRDELRRLAYGNEVGFTPAMSGSAAIQPAMSRSAAIQSAHTPGEVTHPDVRPSSTVATRASGATEPVTPPRRIPPVVWLGLAATAIVLVLVMVYGGGDDTAPGPVERPDARRAEPAGEDAKSKTDRPPASRSGMTVDQLVAEAPADYAEDVKMLLTNRYPQVRLVAGQAIAGAPFRDLQKIPEYIRELARFELADCDRKKTILEKLGAADEVRALPALQAIASMQDDPCELREDLRRVIARFESQN
jgi:serine/threonine protein kinase